MAAFIIYRAPSARPECEAAPLSIRQSVVKLFAATSDVTFAKPSVHDLIARTPWLRAADFISRAESCLLVSGKEQRGRRLCKDLRHCPSTDMRVFLGDGGIAGAFHGRAPWPDPCLHTSKASSVRGGQSPLRLTGRGLKPQGTYLRDWCLQGRVSRLLVQLPMG